MYPVKNRMLPKLCLCFSLESRSEVTNSVRPGLRSRAAWECGCVLISSNILRDLSLTLINACEIFVTFTDKGGNTIMIRCILLKYL